MVASGTKPQLERRLELYNLCKSSTLRTAEGHNPCEMKFGALKKAAAREAQVPRMGTQDEILDAL